MSKSDAKQVAAARICLRCGTRSSAGVEVCQRCGEKLREAKVSGKKEKKSLKSRKSISILQNSSSGQIK